jgi:hypothetical protein
MGFPNCPWFVHILLRVISLRTYLFAFGAKRLLMLAKHIGDIWPIIISEVICWSMNKTFCLQFHDAFLAHLSPH